MSVLSNCDEFTERYTDIVILFSILFLSIVINTGKKKSVNLLSLN